MRGYEVFTVMVSAGLGLRYESPCGVMRPQTAAARGIGGALRIPMRGYEPNGLCLDWYLSTVTNPHAGL